VLGELDRAAVAERLPWLSVWTADDETVVPPQSARLAGAVNVEVQSICPDARVAHGQLPTDPLVTGLVLRALGVAPLSEPSRSDCASLRAVGS
jgi:triacylglycerol lipase